jgi:MFS family permease
VFCSSSAALAQDIVLGKQVFDMTRSEFALGLLGLAEFAPAAVLVLVTGSVADRLDRRRVAAVGLLGEAAVAAGLAWYAGTNPTSPTPIYFLVLAFGVARAFAAPAARALPADIMPPERLPWLVARYSVAWQAAIVVGPVLGGLLYAVDVRLPFISIVILLLVAAGSVLAVRPRSDTGPAAAPPAEEELVRVELEREASLEAAVEPAVGHAGAATPSRASWNEAVEGLRFIKNRPILLGAISLDLFAVLFGGAVALLPAIAETRLGVGAVGLGWLRAAGGIGAGAVTLGLAVRPIRRHVGHVLLAAVAAFGVFTVVLGVTRSFAVAFVAIAALSGADAVSVFVRSTLIPLATPHDKRGRVLAVENVFIGASNELGAFESGVTGQLLGTSGSVVLGGVATLMVAGGWCFVFPSLRKVDTFPEG